LPGGLLAYVVEDATVPLVTLSAFVAAGWADGAPGAARALEAVLRGRGPAPADGSFQDALRRMAAEYRVVLGPEELEITLDVPSADAAEAIALLGRLLREPAFADVDVAALARRSARRSASDAATGEAGPVLYEGSLDAAVDLFHAHLLDGHRYAPTITGADADALTVDLVRDFHGRFFRGGNIVLAVSGDIERTEATRLLRTAFAGFPGGRPSRPRATNALNAPEPRVAHVQTVDKLQGWVVMGHALEPVSRQDEAALLVMNYILGGGHFDARLFIEVRDKRGLANTGGAFPEWRRRGPGSYTLRTYGRPETIPLLVKILQDEAARIRTEPVSEESLRVAKGALADGEFGMWFHNGEATARTFARERLHEGDHRGSATFRERVAAVTIADVQAAANRFLHPDRLRMVVIGPLDRIRQHTPLEGEPPLDAFGRVVEAR
jgi:zinc protease